MRAVRAGSTLVVALAAYALAACGGESTGPELSTVAHAVTPPAPPPHVATPPSTRKPPARPRRRAHPKRENEGDGPAPTVASDHDWLSAADQADFARLQRSLGGSIGLTLSGIGVNRPVTELGALRTGVAWSTIKAPITLAVINQAGGHPDAADQALMGHAIAESDNAAAEALFGRLGNPAHAALAVEQVLADAGDTATRVQPTVTRPGFTAFGQTDWPLASQQRFIAALPCLRFSDQLLQLMGQIESDQSWGLGSSGLPATFKGGWGPDTSGHYLVRQMGLLRLTRGGTVAVTVAAMPPDGSFASGTAELTSIGRWLAAHLAGKTSPPEHC